MDDPKKELKVIYGSENLRKVCDGEKHYSQLRQEDKSWAEDHSVEKCDCKTEEANGGD